MDLRYKKLFSWGLLSRLLTAAICISLYSCGGGTYGTGVRRFEGRVVSTDSAPLSNAKITLLDTGVTVYTDAGGLFALDSDEISSEVFFSLESPQVKTEFSLSGIAEDARRVNLEVVVDTESDRAIVTEFSARLWIIGACDTYFDNEREIKQIAPLPAGTECVIKLDLFGDGRLWGNIPYQFEKRGCGDHEAWQVVSGGRTGIGEAQGQALIPFIFEDINQICEYRVEVPFQYENYRAMQYPIETLGELRREGKHN